MWFQAAASVCQGLPDRCTNWLLAVRGLQHLLGGVPNWRVRQAMRQTTEPLDNVLLLLLWVHTLPHTVRTHAGVSRQSLWPEEGAVANGAVCV